MIKRTIKQLLKPYIQSSIERDEKNGKFSLDPSLWGLDVNEEGHLIIGGCDCVTLAKEYGTPLHVVDRDLLKKNYHEFYENLKSHNLEFEIYYSYKTNPVPGILQFLHTIGAGAEVISPYELWLALKLGVNPDAIIYNGPSKFINSGLKMAIENTIKLININSFDEIESIHTLARELDRDVTVGIRVCTSVGWGSQFGFKILSGEAYEAVDMLVKSSRLHMEGIHVHLGTNIKHSSVYEKAIEDIFQFMHTIKEEKGVSIKYLDLGGGFSVPTVGTFNRFESRLHYAFNRPYSAPEIQDTPSIKIFVDKIASAIKAAGQKHQLPLPTLIVEPGRAMTSNTQLLLASVGALKREDDEKKIAITDAGINIAQPVPMEYHEVFVANKMTSKHKTLYRITGPICTPSDLLYHSKKLPVLEMGDILSIMDAGAYFTSFSNNFSFPRPAVIMVSQGQHRILRQKENYEDMSRLDNL